MASDCNREYSLMARTIYLSESESQDFKESVNHRRGNSQYSRDDALTLESLSEIPGVGE